MVERHNSNGVHEEAAKATSLSIENSATGAEAIRAFLVSRLSELLGIASHEVDIREPLASYGLGSTELVGLSGDLAQLLGRQLPAELAYECPTIEALALRWQNHRTEGRRPSRCFRFRR